MTMVPSKGLYVFPLLIVLGALYFLVWGLVNDIYLLNHDLLEITVGEEYYMAVGAGDEVLFLSKDTEVTYTDHDDRRGNVLVHFDEDGNQVSLVWRVDEMEDKHERYEITFLLDDDYQVGEYHSLFKVKFFDNNEYEFYTRAIGEFDANLVIDNTDKSEERMNIVIYIVVFLILDVVAFFVYRAIHAKRSKRLYYVNHGTLDGFVYKGVFNKQT